jgi:FMN reductase
MTMQPGVPAGPPLVLGIAAFPWPGSAAELMVHDILATVAARRAQTRLLDVRELDLPLCSPHATRHPDGAALLWSAVGAADAVVVGASCPGGNVGGLLGNALDYLRELYGDDRSCLQGLPVATVVSAHDWESAVTALGNVRQTVHALGGWPTPLGVVVNTAGPAQDERLPGVVDTVAEQLLTRFAAYMPASQPDATVPHAC